MLPLLIICMGILTRLAPHFPDFSPEIVFALYLGMRSPKQLICLYIFLIAMISDLLIGWQNAEFSSFGNWTLFTYSALLVIGGAGLLIRKKGFGLAFLGTSCATTVAFWIWTNFGTWLMTNLYPHTATGLAHCYVLALPFLAKSLAASFAWCAIIALCEHCFPKSYKQASRTY